MHTVLWRLSKITFFIFLLCIFLTLNTLQEQWHFPCLRFFSLQGLLVFLKSTWYRVNVRVCVMWCGCVHVFQLSECFHSTVERVLSIVSHLLPCVEDRSVFQEPAVLKVHFTSPPEPRSLGARPLIDCCDHWSNFEAFWIFSLLSLLFVRSWINLIFLRHMQGVLDPSGKNRENK